MKKQKGGTSESKAVAEVKQQQQSMIPAGMDFAKHAGGGMENTDRESFAIPFLAIMQKGSPQVDKDNDAFVKGAEVGDLLLTTSNEVFKDEDGVDIIFCGYRRVFTRWTPQDAGGGFKGELTPDQVAAGKISGKFREEDNRLFAADGDILKDTRIHYVLVLREGGLPSPAVISITSTQIKKSKMLMTQLQSYLEKDNNGHTFTPASFSHVFHAETIAEQNDKGSWRGWKFTRKGYVTSPDLYAAAHAFSQSVREEKVRVDYASSDVNAAGSSNTETI